MSKRRQSGFSLLELLVAMMIMAVLGTLGFTQYRKYATRANNIKAHETLNLVSKGLASYYLSTGQYPELATFDAMVGPGSPLVKKSCIPVNVPTVDPWGQPYEGNSGKGTFMLKCLGDPGNQEDYPAFTETPDKISGGDSKKPDAGPDEGAKDGAKPEGGK